MVRFSRAVVKIVVSGKHFFEADTHPLLPPSGLIFSRLLALLSCRLLVPGTSLAAYYHIWRRLPLVPDYFSCGAYW